MSEKAAAAPHMIDLIRKKRDGGVLDAREIGFIVAGAASETIPLEQLSAWLMAAWLNGLTIEETRALAIAMRDSGEKFDPSRLGKQAVDKHSTGGVGDKTSFLVAPLAAACGVAVPMISGRALGHTGGTLDKLDSIPGFRSALTLAEFEVGAAAVRCSDRQPDADARSRRSRSLCLARSHRNRGESRADLRLDLEQETGCRVECPGAGREDGLGRLPAQARRCGVPGSAHGGNG